MRIFTQTASAERIPVMDVSLFACVNKQGQIRAREAGDQGPCGEKALGSKQWEIGGRKAEGILRIDCSL